MQITRLLLQKTRLLLQITRLLLQETRLLLQETRLLFCYFTRKGDAITSAFGMIHRLTIPLSPFKIEKERSLLK